MFNLIETFDELIGESFNPLDVFVFHLEKRVTNLGLPLSDDVNVRLIVTDRFRRKSLDIFKVFQLLLVLFVDVVQIFFGHDALEALILLILARPEMILRLTTTVFTCTITRLAYRKL